jgi:hypothetical protein
MSTICPYPGLRPFNEEESIFFKGREQQVESLVKRLEEKKFLMVNGASGDGKSSLIYAGVIPYAKAGFFKAKYNNWIVADFRPERSPLKNLTSILCKLLKIEDKLKTEKELGYGFSALCDLFKSSSFYVDETNAKWLNADENERKNLKRKGANLLVLVDQFEEFFTNAENYQNGIPSIESQKTVNLLLETFKLATTQDLPIYVVCTMRSDYIGQCAAFRGLPEAVGFSQFFVPRLKRQEIEQVIEGPAALVGCSVSNRLTQVLLNSLNDGFDQLPILQHALNQIWKAAKNGQQELDLIHLAKVGGISAKMLHVDDRKEFQAWFNSLPNYKKQLLEKPSLSNVLNAHANELLFQDEINDAHLKSKLEQRNIYVIKCLFQALTAFDKGRIIRRRATVGEVMDLINDPSLSLKEFNAYILKFREEGNSFIRPYLNESADVLERQVVLDITHESLIRNWKLVEQWVIEEVDNIQTWYEIEKPMRVWQKNVPKGYIFWFISWRFSKLQKYVLSSGLYTLYNAWNKKFPVHLAWLKRISSQYNQQDVDDYYRFLKQSKWVNLWNKVQPYIISLVILYFVFQINLAKIKEGENALKNEKIQKELVIKAESNANIALLAKREADSLKNIAQLREKKAIFNLDSTLKNAAMVVGATKMNVLYIGVENPIDIGISGVSNKDVIVRTSKGSVIKHPDKNSSSYIVTCEPGVKQVEFACSVKNGNRIIPINGKSVFRVKNIPDPVAVIAGFGNKSNFKVSDLKSFKELSAMILNFDFGVPMKIKSFTVTAQVGGEFKSESVLGSNFSNGQKSVFYKGDVFLTDTVYIEDARTNIGYDKVVTRRKVIIEDIKVAMADGTIRKLNPLILNIEKD